MRGSGAAGVRRSAAAALLAVFFLGAPAHADQWIYVQRQDGVRHFSDRKPAAGSYTRIKVTGRPTATASCLGLTPVTMQARADHYAALIGKHARANGLDLKVGSLTPGKQADLIMLRTDRINVTPLNDPATAVVAGMDTSNVDTVLIAGRAMKSGGKLLHVDWPAVKRAVDESRDHVIAKSGFRLPKI